MRWAQLYATVKVLGNVFHRWSVCVHDGKNDDVLEVGFCLLRPTWFGMGKTVFRK